MKPPLTFKSHKSLMLELGSQQEISMLLSVPVSS